MVDKKRCHPDPTSRQDLLLNCGDRGPKIPGYQLVPDLTRGHTPFPFEYMETEEGREVNT